MSIADWGSTDDCQIHNNSSIAKSPIPIRTPHSPIRNRQAPFLSLGIGAAQNDDDVFVEGGHVPSREDRGECCCATGFDDESEDVPQLALGTYDVVVLDEQHAVDVLLRDRKGEVANASRRE